MEPGCSYGHVNPGCDRPAKWVGTFQFGVWTTVVYLCDQHAQAFQYLIDTWQRGMVVVGQPGIGKEIRSLESPTVPAGHRKPLTCDVCGMPIVRQDGIWKAQPTPMEFTNEADARRYDELLTNHEHRPG